MTLLQRVWISYSRLLQSHPVMVPALTTGILMGAGDLAAQSLNGYNLRHMDMRRATRVLLLGAFVYGPFLNKWYYFISRRFAGQRHRVLKMVAADQLLLAPFTIVFYVSAVSVLSTGGTKEVEKQLEKLPEMMVTNYKLWPAVQAFNFAFAPDHLRLLVVNCVTLIWNTYLSWVMHQPKVTTMQTTSNSADSAALLKSKLDK